MQVKPVCDFRAFGAVVTMSFEDIICEVQSRPEVWLSSHQAYKNRMIKMKVWKEISMILGLEGNHIYSLIYFTHCYVAILQQTYFHLQFCFAKNNFKIYYVHF